VGGGGGGPENQNFPKESPLKKLPKGFTSQIFSQCGKTKTMDGLVKNSQEPPSHKNLFFEMKSLKP
jgi:hypothetical protein